MDTLRSKYGIFIISCLKKIEAIIPYQFHTTIKKQKPCERQGFEGARTQI
tara:strand:+ start:711 stop:860 length:150 start_codon:yes stop_codon:yes gene_type:complete